MGSRHRIKLMVVIRSCNAEQGKQKHLEDNEEIKMFVHGSLTMCEVRQLANQLHLE